MLYSNKNESKRVKKVQDPKREKMCISLFYKKEKNYPYKSTIVENVQISGVRRYKLENMTQRTGPGFPSRRVISLAQGFPPSCLTLSSDGAAP